MGNPGRDPADINGWGRNKKAVSILKRPLYLVEDIGVEPTTSCMPCKRSSQLS